MPAKVVELPGTEKPCNTFGNSPWSAFRTWTTPANQALILSASGSESGFPLSISDLLSESVIFFAKSSCLRCLSISTMPSPTSEESLDHDSTLLAPSQIIFQLSISDKSSGRPERLRARPDNARLAVSFFAHSAALLPTTSSMTWVMPELFSNSFSLSGSSDRSAASIFVPRSN